ncbi:hypothetical protein [Longitalea arenae]|uniref:hypothetical protein n=1 Tax=Longitalea arenae TaxID=2812558 RepID=UPI001966D860|nr:hypothetical protein [Longitalea arenae]
MCKTCLATIVGAVLLHIGALAQLYVKSPGNVGIGIQTPSTKLHVNGDVIAGVAGGGYHLIVNDVPTARWALGTGAHAFHIANDYPVTGTWGDKFVISKEGNVGIGTPTPSASYKLDVVGSAKANLIDINSGTADGGRLIFRSEGFPEWRIRNFNGLGFFPGEGAATSLWLDNSGTVGIGVQNTDGHKLRVDGSVRAVSFTANSGNTWADYVFDSTYHLPSLTAVKNYIQQNHHLPDVPSADDVNRDGVNIVDNQVILLKKIEELMLYVIEQNEKQQLFERELKAVKEENEALKERINHLKKDRKEARRK